MSAPVPRAGVGHRHPREVEEQLREAVVSDEVISLAGGVPADELFPAAEMDEAMARVMREAGADALQYGWPQGSDPLREWIAARMAARGAPVAVEQVLITSGAQQALHLLGRLLLPEGAPLAVERPTYASALQAFDLHRAAYRPVPRAARGLDLDALEHALRDQGARTVYLVASGHNPTGGVLSPAEREAVLELVGRHDAWLIDDDAYGEVVFGEPPRPLRSLGCHLDHVIHVGSFSKVLAPGLRVGWIAGPAELIRQLAVLKQAEDMETAKLTQHVLRAWLDARDLDAHIARCLAVYRARRDALLAALDRELAGLGRWERPDAGFSLLLELSERLDLRTLLPRALDAGVAFEPATPYFASQRAPVAIRLSYSNLREPVLEQGVTRLAAVIRRGAAGD